MKRLGKNRLSLKKMKVMHVLLLLLSFEAAVVRILGAVLFIVSLGCLVTFARVFKHSDPKDTHEFLFFAAMGVGTIFFGEAIRWGVIRTRLWLARLASE